MKFYLLATTVALAGCSGVSHKNTSQPRQGNEQASALTAQYECDTTAYQFIVRTADNEYDVVDAEVGTFDTFKMRLKSSYNGHTAVHTLFSLESNDAIGSIFEEENNSISWESDGESGSCKKYDKLEMQPSLAPNSASANIRYECKSAAGIEIIYSSLEKSLEFIERSSSKYSIKKDLLVTVIGESGSPAQRLTTLLDPISQDPIGTLRESNTAIEWVDEDGAGSCKKFNM